MVDDWIKGDKKFYTEFVASKACQSVRNGLMITEYGRQWMYSSGLVENYVSNTLKCNLEDNSKTSYELVSHM